MLHLDLQSERSTMVRAKTSLNGSSLPFWSAGGGLKNQGTVDMIRLA